MTLTRRAVPLVAATAAVGLLAAACSSSGSTSPSASAATFTKGGTVTVYQTGDFEFIDPGRMYVTNADDFGQLMFRQLVSYKVAPGETTTIVPDLATNLGVASNDDKTWTYTIQPGIKYANGAVITTADIKWAIERTYSPLITSGAFSSGGYGASVLVGGSSYTGPYGGKQLASIETPNSTTIIFHTTKPYPDFPYLMALSGVSAPVPQTADTKTAYNKDPLASGPYMIPSGGYAKGKSLTLVRNPYFDPKTDPNNPAYPNGFQFNFTEDPNVVDQRMIADQPADQASLELTNGIQPANIPQVLSSPQLLKRVVQGPNGCEYYIAINMKRVPNQTEREALQYAFNKQSWREALGGQTYGAYASTMLPPTIHGYQAFNLFPAPATGDPTKAKQLLTQAGVPSPTLSYAFAQTPTNTKAAEAFQAGMGAAGIHITLDPIPQASYYTTVGDISKPYDLIDGGWCPDWPSALTILPALFAGSAIIPQGNVNWSQMNIPAVNTALSSAEIIQNQTQADAAWGALDKQIMGYSPALPGVYSSTFALYGSKIQNAFLSENFGLTDLAGVAVAP